MRRSSRRSTVRLFTIKKKTKSVNLMQQINTKEDAFIGTWSAARMRSRKGGISGGTADWSFIGDRR
jgi:hypothetical protein